MSTILFANNANSTLAGAITNTAVTLNIQAGAGALFPSPGTGQYFVATLLDAATRTVREIIWVTGRSGDVLTVVRGQEGTSAENWLAGDFIANQLTAGQMAAFPQNISAPVSTSEIYYGVDTGVADALVVTTIPVITAYTDGMVFEITPIATNLTSTPQMNVCTLGAKQFSNALPGYIVAGQKFFCSYDGTLGKLVLITLPNTATTSMRGIARQATTTEATNATTSGSVPAFMTPEDVGLLVAGNPAALPVATTTTRGVTRLANSTEATNGVTSGTVPATMTPEDTALYVAGQVANTGARGISREATTGEATAGVTSGSVPAFMTPEDVAAALLNINPWTSTAVGALMNGKWLFGIRSGNPPPSNFINFFLGQSFNLTTATLVGWGWIGGSGNDWELDVIDVRYTVSAPSGAWEVINMTFLDLYSGFVTLRRVS